MIQNVEGCRAKSEGRPWHYLAVKKISVILRGISAKNNGCLIF